MSDRRDNLRSEWPALSFSALNSSTLSPSKGSKGLALSLSKGFTMIELIVSVAILTLMILGVGFVFKQSSTAVGIAEGNMEIQSALRAGSGVLRDDFRKIAKDGFLCIVDATPDTPPLLIFTAAGHYQSMTMPGQERNAALLVYTLAKDQAVSDENGNAQVALLSRRAHLLVAEADAVFNLPNGAPVLGDLLLSNVARIRSETDQNLLGYYVSPLNSNLSPRNQLIEPLNSSPTNFNEVNGLWPYMIGNVKNVRFEFYDGQRRNNYANPIQPNEAMQWLTAEDAGNRSNYDPPGVSTGTINGAPYVLWRHTNPAAWPKAVKAVLTMQDVTGRTQKPQVYEIILKMPG